MLFKSQSPALELVLSLSSSSPGIAGLTRTLDLGYLSLESISVGTRWGVAWNLRPVGAR